MYLNLFLDKAHTYTQIYVSRLFNSSVKLVIIKLSKFLFDDLKAGKLCLIISNLI